MTEWFEALSGLLDRVWDTLKQGVADAEHAARLPTLATTSPAGLPEARTVVLRSADQEQGEVTFHTDLYSDKIKSLTERPLAALHIWDASQSLQIRLQADVAIQTGINTRPLWDEIPDHARQSYGVSPPPGTPINTALDYVKAPDPATFAVLRCRIATIDAVHLGEHHRRAAYSRSDDWAGQWLSP